MERGQGDFIGDSGGIETNSASSVNNNGHIADLVADGVSTDGEHLILGQHDDASFSPGERYFRPDNHHARVDRPAICGPDGAPVLFMLFSGGHATL